MVKCKRKTSNSWTENDMQKAIKAFREGRNQSHADWGRIKAKECVENMKTRTGTSREPTSVIIQNELERIASEANVNLLKKSYIRKTVRRAKKRHLPPEPRNIDELNVIADRYTKTVQGERWWLYLEPEDNGLFVPPLPANLHELRDPIIATVALIDCDILTRVWDEMNYRLGICRINNGRHILEFAYEVIVLYGCESSTLTLREERRLRVFENKVLRKIFGAKIDEITGERRKLHNAELHALYSSPDIIRNIKSRRLRWAGHVARMDESRNAYRVLVGRPEGKRPLWRPRRRWEDNIKIYFREVGYDDRDWINLAQDRDRWWAYVRAAINLRVP
ncbi:hypothetical protein ANN_23078 [Periplaneta americana]|uniref:Uncharacterized protein n=1 Tax=Periplaneta americana TaxID=6978 RepID=A0ABQ8SK66_PERAM|nr:hypothetical protein ANN_23078 [Periplaneta americana]